jgi:hypothetical protein
MVYIFVCDIPYETEDSGMGECYSYFRTAGREREENSRGQEVEEDGSIQGHVIHCFIYKRGKTILMVGVH